MTEPRETLAYLSNDELTQLFRQAAHANDGSVFDRFPFPDFNPPSPVNGARLFEEASRILEKCRALTPDLYRHLHKGTPFYWMAVGAFLMHDYETAVFYFDAAMSQDLRRSARGLPAEKFVSLDSSIHQAAFPLVNLARKKLQSSIAVFNVLDPVRTLSAQLSLERVRESFLCRSVADRPEWRALATAFISFFLEWDHRAGLLDLRASQGTMEPFLVHLLKGALVFETLLKVNPTHPRLTETGTLGTYLGSLHGQLGVSGEITKRIGRVTFAQVCENASHGITSLDKALELAGQIRNTVAHDLTWAICDFDPALYHCLAECVASACLLAIDRLYSSPNA